MLDAITKKMTDDSDASGFCFTFYCDLCGSPERSAYYAAGNVAGYESGRIAAFERANREAMPHFNRCPVCKRVVCDACFRILDERDMCKDCSRGNHGV